MLILFLIRKITTGHTVFIYLIYYSVGRFFIEGMRTDSLMIGDMFRTAQVISVITIIAAIALMIYRQQKYNLPKYGDDTAITQLKMKLNIIRNHQQ